jgi:hypothetical protein
MAEGDQRVQIFHLSGINDRAEPWFLGEDESAFLQNFDVSFDGSRRKRDGCRPASVPVAVNNRGTGLFYFPNGPIKGDGRLLKQTSTVVCCDGDNIRVFDSDGDLWGLYYGKLYDKTAKHVATRGYQYVAGDDRYNPCLWIAPAYHPTTATNTVLQAISYRYGGPGISETQTDFRPCAITWFQGRLWKANDSYHTGATGVGEVPGPSYAGSALWPSDLFNGTSFTHPPLYVEPGIGGDIVAITPLRSIESALVIWKETAICILYPRWGTGGNYISAAADTIDTVASQVKIISESIGCAAAKSIVEVGIQGRSDYAFLASDGHVRLLSRVEQDVEGGAGIPLTHNIPNFINSLSFDHLHKSSAAFFDNKYYLITSMAAADDVMLIIDTLRGRVISTDYIDEKAGDIEPVPNIKPVGIFNPGGGGFGTADALRHSLFFSSWASDTGISSTSTGPNRLYLYRYRDPDRNMDPGRKAIEAVEDTRGFTFETMLHKKRWVSFAYMAEAMTNVTAQVDISYRVDSGAWTSLQSSVIEPAASARLKRRSYSLEDIDPGYVIQFRLVEEQKSGPLPIYYIEAQARIIPEETDNTIS